LPQQSAAKQGEEMVAAKLKYMKHWINAFMLFAEQHQWEFPTTFEQAAGYLPAYLPSEVEGQINLAPDLLRSLARNI
jgi:hypothetical protein